ncbi:MAG: Na+/H+ antiporter NhaC family protein [Gammaproteobacteria bacterium]
MTATPSRYSWLILVAALIGVSLYAASFSSETITSQGHYGFLSLLPAVATLAICFTTRNVILALFTGILFGGAITGKFNIIDEFLVPSLGTEKYAQILLVYLWALGGLLGIWNRNGGALRFGEVISANFVKSRRSALFFTWLMGVLFHQGGTISTVLTGTSVKPVADRENVSHEELAYVVDSTASPVATIIPFNVWPIYVAGLITIDSLSTIVTDSETAVGWFLKAIPFNFYAWFAVLFTLLFAFDKLPFTGRSMKQAIQRAKDTGALDREDAQPMLAKELSESSIAPGYTPSLVDFIAPIAVLLLVSIVPWILSGSPMVFEAFGLALVCAVTLSVSRGMRVSDAFDGIVSGIKGVTIGAIVLGLAVTLGTVSESLGASQYVIQTTASGIGKAPWLLPGLLMLVCMSVAFSIGSSWGTYAVVFPIALPLAYTITPDPTYFLLNFGAIMGGAVFGDQCSPISDTTILSSLACGSDLMDHVNTQLPMALSAAALAVVLSTTLAFFIV